MFACKYLGYHYEKKHALSYTYIYQVHLIKKEVYVRHPKVSTCFINTNISVTQQESNWQKMNMLWQIGELCL